jgi:glutathione S-transferase
VPTLELDDSQILTEGAAIVQYLADRKPEAKLAPANGTLERYRLQEWLSFIGSELHKTFGVLFNAKLGAEARQTFLERLASRLDHVERRLSKGSYLMGESFSVADAYLFAVLRWSPRIELDLARWPGITQFVSRMMSRPAVQAAMKAEGLS